MSGSDLAMLAWLVAGVAFGLVGANAIWKSPGPDAFVIFEQAQRDAVDRLHHELGLGPVDWEVP